jgi:hypothetical protein
MGSKLADSLRQVRGEKPATPEPALPPTASAEKRAASRPEPPHPPRVAGSAKFAQQSDQSPPASLDRPWDNLHPARIWPD